MSDKKVCVKCGRPISGRYSWKGELYGKTCWKNHALPELLAERAQADAERAQAEYEDTSRLIQVLENKKLDRITNAFKLSFIPSVIEQFNERGFITRRQREIAASFLSGTDFDNWQILEWRDGAIPIEYVTQISGLSEEQIKNYKKI